MAKIKIHETSDSFDEVTQPTQNQMDQWVQAELAEATVDNMLDDEVPVTLFNDSTNESID